MYVFFLFLFVLREKKVTFFKELLRFFRVWYSIYIEDTILMGWLFILIL